MAINSVSISGNLTRDPEVRQTQSGTCILNFGVAVNERRKNPQTGEWEDYPNFIDCMMFGQRAESVSKFLSKGMMVAINGKLRYSSWERAGQRRSKVEVVVEDIEFMSRNQQNQGEQQRGNQQNFQNGGYKQGNQGGYQQNGYQASQGYDVYDEDMPF